MERDECQVWNLLDPEGVQGAIQHVDAQIEEAQRELILAREADAVLAEIEDLLRSMEELARQAAEPDADREVLEAVFAARRARVDLVVEAHVAALPPSEGRQLRELLASLLRHDNDVK